MKMEGFYSAYNNNKRCQTLTECYGCAYADVYTYNYISLKIWYGIYQSFSSCPILTNATIIHL